MSSRDEDRATCLACGLVIKKPGVAYVTLGGMWCECPPPSFETGRFRCQKCGSEYLLALGNKATAPHGPNKDCTSQSWEYIAEDPEE